MVKLRKGKSYRKVENRAYTRISKYKKKSYISTRPQLKITKYDTGATDKKFPFEVSLISKSDLQLRHQALESARLTCNRTLEKVAGTGGYHLKLVLFPHHMLRENPTATGAGADRMSTGMKMSFGKIIGAAARVREGQKVFTAFVNKPHLDLAKLAMKKAAKKLPNSYGVLVEEKK